MNENNNGRAYFSGFIIGVMLIFLGYGVIKTGGYSPGITSNRITLYPDQALFVGVIVSGSGLFMFVRSLMNLLKFLRNKKSE